MMRTFCGHTGFVQSLAFSPVGSLVASGGADGRVCVWDSLTGKLVYEAQMDGENIGAVAFSPDGAYLAAGSHEGNVHLFSLAEGSEPVSSWTDRGRVTALAFTPDGNRLALSSYPGWAIYHLATPPWASIPSESGRGHLFILRISPNGKIVATAGKGPHILLYDLESPANPIRLPHGDRGGVWSLSYSPDGRTLAAALAGGVQLWDATAQRFLQEWRDHDDVTTGIAISPDGTRLLTCSRDRTARLYEFDLLGQRRGAFVGCYDWGLGRLFDVAISPDSTLAVAGGDEGDYVVAWDIE
jgi:WD40 repeat protein